MHLLYKSALLFLQLIPTMFTTKAQSSSMSASSLQSTECDTFSVLKGENKQLWGSYFRINAHVPESLIYQMYFWVIFRKRPNL